MMEKRYYRRVIRIRAEDSPNVQLGIAEEKAGKKPSHKELVPGVLSYAEYCKRRQLWDKVKQCISLDGEFHEGAEELLFPAEWLNLAEKLASQRGSRGRAESIGVDPAYGGNFTVLVAADQGGIVAWESRKTPDTAVITGAVLAFAQKYGVPKNRVYFDVGGGGQVHVDRLRSQGHKVNGIPFGGAATPERRRGIQGMGKLRDEDLVRFSYKNKRAEMYGELSRALDPNDGGGFAIPAEYVDLRQQLAPIPRWYDGEGKLWLPPKRKDPSKPNVKTLTDILGRSPDDADALVLAVYGLKQQKHSKAGGPAF